MLEPAEYVRPREFIILEGLHGYSTPPLREHYDLKFYLEPQEPLRLRWKFQRDTGPGGFGYTVEQVMALLPSSTATAPATCARSATTPTW